MNVPMCRSADVVDAIGFFVILIVIVIEIKI